MIRDNDCGLAIPPGDVRAFADALEFAAANRAELAAMGQRSRALARARFARDDLADKFADWLEGAYSERYGDRRPPPAAPDDENGDAGPGRSRLLGNPPAGALQLLGKRAPARTGQPRLVLSGDHSGSTRR